MVQRIPKLLRCGIIRKGVGPTNVDKVKILEPKKFMDKKKPDKVQIMTQVNK